MAACSRECKDCYNYDLEKLATKGMYFIGNVKTTPAKHLTTFTDHLLEMISWVNTLDARLHLFRLSTGSRKKYAWLTRKAKTNCHANLVGIAQAKPVSTIFVKKSKAAIDTPPERDVSLSIKDKK